MDKLRDYAPRVNKKMLLLFAGIVWVFAGYKVLSIGIPDMVANWTLPIINIFIATVIFMIFFKKVFYTMYKKHSVRILNYDKIKICAFAFFDKKGYIVMGFMMTFGILLRSSHIVKPLYLGTFYTGLGASLASAGICFIVSFITSVYKNKSLMF